jgi:hypothetical protein
MPALPTPQPAPAPINRPSAVLADRGHAAVTVIRLRCQLADLDATDRAHVTGMLRELVADVTRTA